MLCRRTTYKICVGAAGTKSLNVRSSQMSKQIKVDEGLFEHILNCIANQKYIGEMTKEVQKEWRETIDKAWNDGMAILSKARR